MIHHLKCLRLMLIILKALLPTGRRRLRNWTTHLWLNTLSKSDLDLLLMELWVLLILYMFNILIQFSIYNWILFATIFHLFILHLFNRDFFISDIVKLIGVFADVSVLFAKVCVALVFDGDILFCGFLLIVWAEYFALHQVLTLCLNIVHSTALRGAIVTFQFYYTFIRRLWIIKNFKYTFILFNGIFLNVDCLIFFKEELLDALMELIWKIIVNRSVCQLWLLALYILDLLHQSLLLKFLIAFQQLDLLSEVFNALLMGLNLSFSLY